MDFSTETLNITFPADEQAENFKLQISVDIPIVDDEIDEADREFFILYLSLMDNTLPELFGTVVSVGGIDDNDSR